MNTKDPITSLFQKARDYAPFGEPRQFGFETRLRAALSRSAPSLTESIARLSWGFSFAFLPLLIALAAFLAFQQHGQLPEGISGFVAHWSHWTNYLPVDI